LPLGIFPSITNEDSPHGIAYKQRGPTPLKPGRKPSI
jgi:hypothetical protein